MAKGKANKKTLVESHNFKVSAEGVALVICVGHFQS
jgi:hypothetical protein